METAIPKKRLDEILAEVMNKNVSDIRSLLTNNGVVNAQGLSDADTNRAFLKAIKDSASFRSDLSSYLTDLVQSKASFVKQPNMVDFVNQPQLNFNDAFTTVDDIPTATTTTVTPTTTKTSSFWDTLGGLASKSNLQSLFNTGLSVASTSLQNKANQTSEQNALELERLKLEQIQAQKDLATTGASKKISTLGWIGIGVGGLALITGIVLLARK